MPHEQSKIGTIAPSNSITSHLANEFKSFAENKINQASKVLNQRSLIKRIGPIKIIII